MATKKKTSSTRNKKKRSSKKKPKVKLNNKSVIFFSFVIVLLCGIFLFLNIKFNSESKVQGIAQVSKEMSSSQDKSLELADSADMASKNSSSYDKETNSAKKKSSLATTDVADKKSSGKSENAQTSNKSLNTSETASKSENSSVKAENLSSNEKTAKSHAEKEKFIQEEKPSANKNADTNTKSSKKEENLKKNALASTNSSTLREKSSIQSEKFEKSIKSAEKTLENGEKSSLPQKYDIPPSKNHAKIAFVIDDAGLNVNNLKRYTSLPFALTIAVLPRLSHSKDCAYVVRNSGQELILHQPMQSVNLNLNPGDGAIEPEMSTFEIAQTVKQNLDEIGPNVKGMNNHEGSLISANVIKIGTVLDVALERNIYFLDSRTNVETKAPQAALERDMKIYERDIFIDNVLDKDSMLKEILKGLEIANRKGHVIMIGHVDKSINILPSLLNELYPYLREKGYVLCFVSEI